jgi:hypothetical protein
VTRILKTRITKQAVDRLLAGEMIRDTDLAGFGVRRQKSAPTYFLQKRIGRRVRWITVGRLGYPWMPEQARKEAYRLLGQIVGGEEPRMRRQAGSALRADPERTRDAEPTDSKRLARKGVSH